ncbi:cytochrome P450 [Lentinus tigrinus ALCF2SS1-7]|uniref:cytochrome P450 n=1 Tax=Lentinus tigrinus ALCF2SS1-7 TaxID=1328758 RepID=UPI0011662E3D|nr:cytochrome P450 [Lentinus tigrinus ALCF2SS1-7]
MGPYLLALAIIALSLAAQKILTFWRLTKAINNHAGFRTLFSDRFALFHSHIPGITPGFNFSFTSKHAYFAQAGWDVLSSVNLSRHLTYYVADAALAREITSARARFPKPADFYAVLAVLGPNILVAEGDAWRHQRRVVAPAFSERNNRLVWDETARIVRDLVEDVWRRGPGAGKDTTAVDVDHVLDVTVPLTLFVIGSAGFGHRMSWQERGVAPRGHSMSFKDALDVVGHTIFYKLLFPDWALRWGSPGMRRFHRAYTEIQRYMVEMVEARRRGPGDSEGEEVEPEERHDLFNSLLDANDAEEEEAAKLSDSALMGNIFIFLLAGYETTAHSLAYALILLALHQDEQERLYQHIKTVIPDGRTPTYEDFTSLTYAMAVFHETLRLFPPIIGIPKVSAEDTSFTFSNASGQKTTVPVPKDSRIVICTPALHYNPRYWDDPTSFKPARFLGNWPREAFLPFSGGPRGCIGRGFAETEAVAALTLLVSQYKISVKDEPQFAGETFEQRKARVLKTNVRFTTYPERAPLVFERR